MILLYVDIAGALITDVRYKNLSMQTYVSGVRMVRAHVEALSHLRARRGNGAGSNRGRFPEEIIFRGGTRTSASECRSFQN